MAKLPKLYVEGFTHGVTQSRAWLRMHAVSLQRSKRTANAAQIRNLIVQINMLDTLIASMARIEADVEDRADLIREAAEDEASK